ncbi:MAG: type II toxin-antitoxin system Phd/YefM family antitoxin [Actinoplanes sp.]
MSSENIGIEDARKRLGDLVTAAQQGANVVLTRNGRPVARIVHYQEATVTLLELAARLGMSAAPEKVARFAGAFTEHDPRTGRLPQPWAGQGLNARFTPAQADQIEHDWYQEADNAERLVYLVPGDPDFAELASRYRP